MVCLITTQNINNHSVNLNYQYVFLFKVFEIDSIISSFALGDSTPLLVRVYCSRQTMYIELLSDCTLNIQYIGNVDDEI